MVRRARQSVFARWPQRFRLRLAGTELKDTTLRCLLTPNSALLTKQRVQGLSFGRLLVCRRPLPRTLGTGHSRSLGPTQQTDRMLMAFVNITASSSYHSNGSQRSVRGLDGRGVRKISLELILWIPWIHGSEGLVGQYLTEKANCLTSFGEPSFPVSSMFLFSPTVQPKGRTVRPTIEIYDSGMNHRAACN